MFDLFFAPRHVGDTLLFLLRLRQLIDKALTVSVLALSQADVVSGVTQLAAQRQARRLCGGATHLLHLQFDIKQFREFTCEDMVPDHKLKLSVVRLEQFTVLKASNQFVGSRVRLAPKSPTIVLVRAMPKVDFFLVVIGPCKAQHFGERIGGIAHRAHLGQIDHASGLEVPCYQDTPPLNAE